MGMAVSTSLGRFFGQNSVSGLCRHDSLVWRMQRPLPQQSLQPKDVSMKLSLLLVPILGLSLSACAMQSGDFPSLSKRPYEDVPAIDDAAAPPPPQIAALPATLKKAVDAAVRQSNTAHQAFLASLPKVKQSVSAARGAAPSSESWVVAQVQLSSLEMDRSPSVSALADIDSLYFQRLDQEFTGEQKGAAALIALSRQQIEAQVSKQQSEMDQLKAGIR